MSKDILHSLKDELATIAIDANFINKDKQEFSIRKKFIDDLERELLAPDEESSTELGEIPQEKFKGSIPKYGFPTRGIYRYNY